MNDCLSDLLLLRFMCVVDLDDTPVILADDALNALGQCADHIFNALQFGDDLLVVFAELRDLAGVDCSRSLLSFE